MRKQTKWAVILGAAAVMTFGACMTSFAATGWVEEDGAWYYYDKDEEAVSEVWKKAADGKYYYLGEDGEMVTDTWVDGDTRYYANSNGARTTSEWRLMFGYEDDEAEEESWFWFDANGKMATGKKAINGKTYYFDEEGKMLTGWIDIDSFSEAEAVNADVVYCNENGDRVVGWAQLYAPDDEDEEDLYWYNFSSKGEPRINTKKTISGKSYLFDDEGKMISGWACVMVDNTDPMDPISNYVSIDTDTNAADINFATVLYCGSSNDGAVKKSTWVKSVAPTDDADDADADVNWYYLAKDGSLYTSASEDMSAVDGSEYSDNGVRTSKGVYEPVGIRKVGSKYYGFKADGIMISGLLDIQAGGAAAYPEGTYYFGSDNDGALKTGSATLSDEDGLSYSYYFSTKADTRGQGVTGIQSSKLYENGLVVTAPEDSKYDVVAVNGLLYLVNESGKVMTSTSSTYTAESGAKFKVLGGDKELGYTVQRTKGSDVKIATWDDVNELIVWDVAP